VRPRIRGDSSRPRKAVSGSKERWVDEGAKSPLHHFYVTRRSASPGRQDPLKTAPCPVVRRHRRRALSESPGAIHGRMRVRLTLSHRLSTTHRLSPGRTSDRAEHTPATCARPRLDRAELEARRKSSKKLAWLRQQGIKVDPIERTWCCHDLQALQASPSPSSGR